MYHIPSIFTGCNTFQLPCVTMYHIPNMFNMYYIPITFTKYHIPITFTMCAMFQTSSPIFHLSSEFPNLLYHYD
jgi:hypothetical protein